MIIIAELLEVLLAVTLEKYPKQFERLRKALVEEKLPR